MSDHSEELDRQEVAGFDATEEAKRGKSQRSKITCECAHSRSLHYPSGQCGVGECRCVQFVGAEYPSVVVTVSASPSEVELAMMRAKAANNIRRVRDEEDRRSLAPLADDWMDTAMRATGKTREELLALAAELPPHMPPEPPSPPSPSVLARRRMVAANVPELHIRHVADSDPLGCEALTAVRGFLAKPNLGVLVLSGGVGTQKTGSAVWMLSMLDGAYCEAPDLLAIAMEDKPQFLRLRKARAVVLDDLGTEIDDTGKWTRTFNTLFNGWYASCAKLIITCNLTADEFKKAYGERVADRIRERGEWFSVGGASVRAHWSENGK